MLELERETPKNSNFVSSMTYRGISTIDPFHNNAADESPNDYSYPVNILKGFFAASVAVVDNRSSRLLHEVTHIQDLFILQPFKFSYRK
jgi:hypothetical protein